MFKKGIGVIVPLFDVTLCLLMLHYLRLSCFPFPSTVTSSGEDDDLLVYYVSLSVPTPAPIHVKPPITQVYSQHQNPPILSPTPAALTLDPVSNDDLPIALRQGKRQCVHPISTFCL